MVVLVLCTVVGCHIMDSFHTHLNNYV